MIWSLFLQLLSGPPFPSDPAPRSGLTSSLPPPNPSPPSTGRKKGLTVLRATSSSTLSLQKGLTSSTSVEVVGPYTLGCPAGTISKLDPPPSTSWCTCPWCSVPLQQQIPPPVHLSPRGILVLQVVHELCPPRMVFPSSCYHPLPLLRHRLGLQPGLGS